MEFFKKHFNAILLFMFFILLVNQCMISRSNTVHVLETKKMAKKIDSLKIELLTVIVTEHRLKEIIKETPAWTTLSIEESSDKEKVRIQEFRVKWEGAEQNQK